MFGFCCGFVGILQLHIEMMHCMDILHSCPLKRQTPGIFEILKGEGMLRALAYASIGFRHLGAGTKDLHFACIPNQACD